MSTIRLIHGSSVEQKADAIVNAANRYLLAGSGVCGAIFAKAGYDKMTAACSMHDTPLADGEAVMTPSFGIDNARAVIHAVGPDFRYTPEAFEKLSDAYYNSLVVLMENGLRSISFPLISSGIFSGSLSNPAAESAKQCIRAYQKFVSDYSDYEIDVILCAYSDDQYMKALSELEKYEF